MEKNLECDLITVRGTCRKNDLMSCEKCRADKYWFTDELSVCEIGDVCRKNSIFGNSYLKITKDQLKALKEGKVLYEIDEYGTFIILESGVEE